MRRKQRESKSTRETEKAREDEEEEEGSGKQREVLLCLDISRGSVTTRPSRKHTQTDRRMGSGNDERPAGRGEASCDARAEHT